MWYSGRTSLSGSNLGRIFFRCLGRGCWAPRMQIASTKSHGWLASMFPLELDFDRGYGIEAKGGLFSRGPGGLEPPSLASGNSNNAESPFGKSKSFKNWGSF